MNLPKHQALRGQVDVPPSKSMSIRALAAAALAHGESRISRLSTCMDARQARRIAFLLGAEIREEDKLATILGGRTPSSTEFPCGESALCLRLFAPVLSTMLMDFTLVAEGSLQSRLTALSKDAMSEFGLTVTDCYGFPPVRITGRLQAGKHRLDASTTSQVASGLLMALPLLQGDSELILEQAVSRPYLEMTCEIMRQFGVEIRREGWERYFLSGGQVYRPAAFEIERDWSAAAFWLVAGALVGPLTVKSLLLDSTQADKAVIGALRLFGAKLDVQPTGITVTPEGRRPFAMDFSDAPDLFPALLVLATQTEGTSRLTGWERLRHKESNRISALVGELSAMGARIEMRDKTMLVHGGKLRGARLFSHNDHRIAMALAVAAICTDEENTLEGGECVAKTYPDFWDDLKRLSGETP